jgi:antitoxin MazE
MKASIVRIGNSRGIRLPKPILEQCAFEDEVEMEVQRGQLIIRSPHRPRQGWERVFKLMAERRDDRLPDRVAESGAAWDEEEWEW